MENTEIEEKIDIAAKWIAASKHLVVFTGAGISTESGLPDYRGPNGVWTRRDKGLPPPKMAKPWNEIEPNPAHYALVELQEMGILKFLISQNIDNLHLKSGIRQEMIAELHGNRELLRCLKCKRLIKKEEVGWTYKQVPGYDTTLEIPGTRVCPYCNGRIVNSIVNFGEPVPEKELYNSIEHAKKCDVFFTIGTSLVVYPAAKLPAIAMQNGAKVILLNKGETPYDDVVHLRISGNAGKIVPKIVEKVKQIRGLKIE
ncbi:MAG: SIR2 family NAD-dependent protein deacylase [Candidatus Helarchaeota archaeon]